MIRKQGRPLSSPQNCISVSVSNGVSAAKPLWFVAAGPGFWLRLLYTCICLSMFHNLWFNFNLMNCLPQKDWCDAARAAIGCRFRMYNDTPMQHAVLFVQHFVASML